MSATGTLDPNPNPNANSNPNSNSNPNLVVEAAVSVTLTLCSRPQCRSQKWLRKSKLSLKPSPTSLKPSPTSNHTLNHHSVLNLALPLTIPLTGLLKEFQGGVEVVLLFE